MKKHLGLLLVGIMLLASISACAPAPEAEVVEEAAPAVEEVVEEAEVPFNEKGYKTTDDHHYKSCINNPDTGVITDLKTGIVKMVVSGYGNNYITFPHGVKTRETRGK